MLDSLSMSDLIGGLNSTFVGAVIGAAGAIVGGFLGAWFIGWRDDQKRLAEHKAAVRAVLHELAGNLATLRACQQKGGANELSVVHSAYTSLLIPLLSSRLPERVASLLGRAYGRLQAIDGVAEYTKWDSFMAGESDYLAAQQALMAYAKDTLKLKF